MEAQPRRQSKENRQDQRRDNTGIQVKIAARPNQSICHCHKGLLLLAAECAVKVGVCGKQREQQANGLLATQLLYQLLWRRGVACACMSDSCLCCLHELNARAAYV
eukprot:2363246-Prymnesium_polylepis.1